MKIEEIISNDEMRHAIERSGYLIEQRVEQIISEDGYYVQTNPAFRDYYTGKSREYDIFAMSGRKIFKDDANFIFPVVLAECMNNTQPLVFFTIDPIHSIMFYQEIKLSGIPLKIILKNKQINLNDCCLSSNVYGIIG